MSSTAPSISVIRCKTKELISHCYEIRYEVFSDEQGYSRELEVDESVLARVTYLRYDENALHILALEESKPVGTVRLLHPPSTDKYKLGRLAVRKIGRGKRIAQKLVAELEVAAMEMGAKEVYAGAQVPVRPFYEKCGYQATGEVYLDEEQPHIMMVKELV